LLPNFWAKIYFKTHNIGLRSINIFVSLHAHTFRLSCALNNLNVGNLRILFCVGCLAGHLKLFSLWFSWFLCISTWIRLFRKLSSLTVGDSIGGALWWEFSSIIRTHFDQSVFRTKFRAFGLFSVSNKMLEPELSRDTFCKTHYIQLQ
jgi:hypothetical protein